MTENCLSALTMNSNSVKASVEILNVLAKYEIPLSDLSRVLEFVKMNALRLTVLAKLDYSAELTKYL